MKELQLTISMDEANLILDALGQQPFVKVFGLIQKIQQQANQQLNSMEGPAGPIKSFSQTERDTPTKNSKS